ncbi:DoxX family protein [Streptomyces sp. NPDC019396]|uniref:DoxX family protein n=1 Tax=Streptomyces sp. NPDC019396 TaxID=3154687 RepID=UPI0033E41B99
MAILRKLARPMLSATFITGGFQVLRHPKSAVPLTESVAEPLAARVPALPEDPEQQARIMGAVQVGAGVMLALGRFPRLSALALATTLTPTVLAGHWTLEDPEECARQRFAFYRDLSLLGGLLIAVADTHGKPSLARRSRRAAVEGRRSARRAIHEAATSRTARTPRL